MNLTVYNLTTGQILFNTNNAAPTDITGVVEGLYNNQQYYIDVATQQPVEIPTQPTDGSYYWNPITKIWDPITPIVSAQSVRAQRNNLLSAVDQVNPIWYASLTAEQQQELAAYRQAVLDVPQQAGFPTDVNWPTKPTWL